PNDDERTIYVANDIGLFVTTNGGATWTDAGTPLGLPKGIQVNSVKFMPSTGYLYVTTTGRGVWSMYAGNNVSFRLYPTLQNYPASRPKLPTVIPFSHTNDPVTAVPATPPLTGPVPTPTEQKTLKLDASGWALPKISVRGNYDVWFKV